MTLCGYQRIEKIAKSFTDFRKTHPYPIMFYYNTSIINIYKKQIFDSSNKSPIEATKENITNYITIPLNSNSKFSLKYWVLSKESSDSESSSDEQIVDNINIDENTTQTVKRKTISKSSKHSSIPLKTKKQSNKQSKASTNSDTNINVSKSTVLPPSKGKVAPLSKQTQPLKLYSFQFLAQDYYEHCH